MKLEGRHGYQHIVLERFGSETNDLINVQCDQVMQQVV